MKKLWPLLVLAVGFCTTVGGFFYDVIFAGIPYPDPTPAQADAYAYNSGIASTIELIGLSLVVLAILSSAIVIGWNFLAKRLRSSSIQK